MLKRNFTFVMLYLAGVFLLGHNFVSHHHPEEHTEFSHSEQHEHPDTDKDDDSLSSIFSQSQHQNANKEIKIIVKSSDSCQLKIDNSFISAEHFSFQAISQIPGMDDPPEEIKGHIFSFPPSQLSFRGPPASV